MAVESRQRQATVVQLLLAVLVGMLGVLISLWAFSSLVGPQATHEAALRRMADFIYWTQPFIYLGAGLIAGRGDPRGGPMRAPVIGLFLAAIGYLLVRRLNLLPPGSTVPGYMITAGALFALVGAVLAQLLGDHTYTAVGAVVLLGIVAYVAAYFNLGSVAGEVQREVVQRAEGMTVEMKTVNVPDVPVSLLDPENRVELYHTRSNQSGRFRFHKLPIGQYILHTVEGYGLDRSVVEMRVTADRTITGSTPWHTIALAPETRDAGDIFEFD